MLDKLKKFLGFKEAYYKETWHVSFVIYIKGHDASYGDGVHIFNEKLNAKLIPDLRKDLAAESSIEAMFYIKPSQINILSLTKL